jgi:cyanophycinase
MFLARYAAASVLAMSLGWLPAPAFDLPAAARERGYQYFAVGNRENVVTTTSPGLALIGGGTDVDAAFEWMIAKSGGGDFVVLRASGTDAYNPYVYGLGALDSCETIVITKRSAASDSFVVNKIRNAEALFIAGGDQRNYVHFWKGTGVEDAINGLASRGVPIGGTSAGLAIMGEFLFSAENDTVTSAQALANPFSRLVTVDRRFLSLSNMEDIITDSHFVTRDRMGRLVAFLGRIVGDGWNSSPVKGIGIDDKTAVVVDASGSASIRGTGAAYFLRTPGPPEVCQPGTPLTYTNVSVYRASGSATFELKSWSGSGGASYAVSAARGALSSSNGSVY